MCSVLCVVCSVLCVSVWCVMCSVWCVCARNDGWNYTSTIKVFYMHIDSTHFYNVFGNIETISKITAARNDLHTYRIKINIDTHFTNIECGGIKNHTHQCGNFSTNVWISKERSRLMARGGGGGRGGGRRRGWGGRRWRRHRHRSSCTGFGRFKIWSITNKTKGHSQSVHSFCRVVQMHHYLTTITTTMTKTTTKNQQPKWPQNNEQKINDTKKQPQALQPRNHITFDTTVRGVRTGCVHRPKK